MLKGIRTSLSYFVILVGISKVLSITIISNNGTTSSTKNVTDDRDDVNLYTTEKAVGNTTEIEEIQHKLYFPYNLRIIQEVMKKLENQECVMDTLIVLNAMTKHEKWALELFDSFPKFPVGILDGNYYQLGDFDECVQTKEEFESNQPVKGQYCLADIHFKSKSSRHRTSRETLTVKKNRLKYNNTVIHWGICLPTSCSTEDAEIFTREVFSSAAENFEVQKVIVDPKKCHYEKPLPYSKAEIIYGCVVGSFLIFTALATGLHIWSMRVRKTAVAYNVDSIRAQNSSLPKEMLKCFSILHTTKKFLLTKPNELNLESICGIKFLSMLLIISGHSLLFSVGGPIENKKFIAEEIGGLIHAPFMNNTLLVDTFLLISGFLMCRLLLIELDKRKGHLNPIILYIARYIRLTPVYMVVIGFQTTWLYRLGDGPFWESRIGLERERCENSWWTNILYVNNYVNTDQICMFQAWYLAVDYHLFIIAPFLIFLLWKWRRFGELILLCCTIAAVALPFWLHYKDGHDPTVLGFPPEIEDISRNYYFKNVYIKTHMRAGSYCVGLFFGYLVHKLQSSGTKLPRYVTYSGWFLSFCFALLSMFSIVVFLNPEHKENALESAIYASLHRIAWSLAIGWVIVICVTDNADVINRFLSWKPFIPLSRLTYCAYLANGLIEMYGVGIQKQVLYLSKYNLTCIILTHIVLTMVLAFVLCVIFESPIHGLEKILLSREKVKEQKTNSTVRHIEET